MHQLSGIRHCVEDMPRVCSSCGATLDIESIFCINCGACITSETSQTLGDEYSIEGVNANEEDSLNATAPTFSPFTPNLHEPPPAHSEATYYENAQRALEVAKTIGLPLNAESLATAQELLKLQALVQANPKAAQVGQLYIRPPLLPSIPLPVPIPPSSSAHLRKAHDSSPAPRPRTLHSEASDPFQVRRKKRFRHLNLEFISASL
jgi:predicted RNA-binding Zn-ribbon protein involved in translation (DUF1610 family)